MRSCDSRPRSRAYQTPERPARRTWRPPWLLTTRPSTPAFTACSASAGASTPCRRPRAPREPPHSCSVGTQDPAGCHRAALWGAPRISVPGTPPAPGAPPLLFALASGRGRGVGAWTRVMQVSVARARLDIDGQPHDRAQPGHKGPGQAGVDAALERAGERAAAVRRGHVGVRVAQALQVGQRKRLRQLEAVRAWERREAAGLSRAAGRRHSTSFRESGRVAHLFSSSASRLPRMGASTVTITAL